jgi:hypothetical protein
MRQVSLYVPGDSQRVTLKLFEQQAQLAHRCDPLRANYITRAAKGQSRDPPVLEQGTPPKVLAAGPHI